VFEDFGAGSRSPIAPGDAQVAVSLTAPSWIADPAIRPRERAWWCSVGGCGVDAGWSTRGRVRAAV